MSSTDVFGDIGSRCNKVLIVTVPALLWALWYSPQFATAAFALIAAAIIVEVYLLVTLKAQQFRDNTKGCATSLETRINHSLTFVVLSLVAFFAAYWLRSLPAGRELIFWPVVVAISADVGAYVGGRYFRGPLVNRNISEGKTWSGFWWALLVGGVIGLLYIAAAGWHQFSPLFTHDLFGVVACGILLLFLSLLQAAAAMAADLAGSAFKRVCGVKDSSPLFGAHGGAIDRLGSHLAAVTICAGGVYLLQKVTL